MRFECPQPTQGVFLAVQECVKRFCKFAPVSTNGYIKGYHQQFSYMLRAHLWSCLYMEDLSSTNDTFFYLGDFFSLLKGKSRHPKLNLHQFTNACKNACNKILNKDGEY